MKPIITRELILEKYWELANLDVNATKGSITGQLKALELLCEELCRSPEQPSKPAPYRSAWMLKK